MSIQNHPLRWKRHFRFFLKKAHNEPEVTYISNNGFLRFYPIYISKITRSCRHADNLPTLGYICQKYFRSRIFSIQNILQIFVCINDFTMKGTPLFPNFRVLWNVRNEVKYWCAFDRKIIYTKKNAKIFWIENISGIVAEGG